MLVLSRKKSESIQIGENVEITILEVRGDRIRIGISAPRDVPVMRKELLLVAGECPAAAACLASSGTDVEPNLSPIGSATFEPGRDGRPRSGLALSRDSMPRVRRQRPR